MKRFIALTSLVIAVVASALWGVARQDRFPHADHAALFPVCTSCHAGIASGEENELYPAPTDCARCHDDQRVPKVDWPGPVRTATNLKFKHPQHEESSGGVECMACHGKDGSTKGMNVARAQPEARFRWH